MIAGASVFYRHKLPSVFLIHSILPNKCHFVRREELVSCVVLCLRLFDPRFLAIQSTLDNRTAVAPFKIVDTRAVSDKKVYWLEGHLLYF